MLIYLVRHAEYVPDPNQNHAGNSKIGLSSLGEKQARALARYFRRQHLDALISSDLERARQTAQIIAGIRGLPWRLEPRFQEHIVSLNSSDRLWVKEMKRKTKENHDFSAPAGESVNDALRRFQGALQELCLLDAKALGIISHGEIMAFVLSSFWPDKKIPELALASVSALQYDQGVFRLLFWNKKIFSLPVFMEKIKRRLKRWHCAGAH